MPKNLKNSFMRRAWDLAYLGRQNVSPNPCVGSVIAYKNRIIGENWHHKFGEAHAEVNAINAVKKNNISNIKNSEIYVTLEPCFHYGKTPPCVDLLLDCKLKKVNIDFVDPNPLVGGKSIEKLKKNNANIQLQNNNSTSPSIKLTNILPFFTNIKKQRPYIVLKWAETADRKIGNGKNPVAISNKYSQRLVHKWRSESDAILVGRNTALIDDPELNNRFYFGKSPMRVIIDKNNDLPRHLKIFNNSLNTIIFNQIENSHNQKTEFKQITFDDAVLESMLQYLFSKKIGILFVEGGSKLLNSFIDKGLWDEARVLQSKTNWHDIEKNMNINGINAPQLTYGKEIFKSQIDDNQLVIFKNF